MSFLAHWIPSLAAAFVLLIAGLVLRARIRAERRAHSSQPESTDVRKGGGLSRV